jgi:hypothetical protein
MIEYPSMQNSSKAPRKECMVFEKLDGSNFRAKWTEKKGFTTFGTRTQLVDETSDYWGQVVTLFRDTIADSLHKVLEKECRNKREAIVFAEFFGENSFAGRHEDEPHKLVPFDILIGHKQRKFVRPQDFIKLLEGKVEIPRVIGQMNLNDSLIESVRRNDFGLFEGVICKGTETVGNAVGGVWMCKIKTQAYFDLLKAKFEGDWQKYGE